MFENVVLLMYTLEGVSSVGNFVTAFEVSIKPKLSFSNLYFFFFFFFFFFVSKGNLFNVYFTTLQLLLVSCGCGRTSPRTLPWCRLYFILCMWGVGGG